MGEVSGEVGCKAGVTEHQGGTDREQGKASSLRCVCGAARCLGLEQRGRGDRLRGGLRGSGDARSRWGLKDTIKSFL